jgi:Icc-related predicted phosphoesterase
VRVAVVADLHGQLPAVPACDLLVLGGDLTPLGDHAVEAQAAFLDGPLRAWLEGCGAPEVVAVAGNHDFVFERAPKLVPADLPWTYLQDAGATVAGLRVWGSPWTPWFYDWAFNAPREGGEAFLAERFAGCPAGVDVLVVHGPPAGFGDRTTGGLDVGSAAQLELVDRVAPRLHVFGHIHEARGAWRRGPTALVNAAALDGAFAPVPDPVVVVDL